MKICIDDCCLRLEAETQRDAYLVGCIYQAAKEANMDCASSNDLTTGGDHVTLALKPGAGKEIEKKNTFPLTNA